MKSGNFKGHLFDVIKTIGPIQGYGQIGFVYWDLPQNPLFSGES